MTSLLPKLQQKYPNLILDNAQAFFSHPIEEISTLYSSRKFFGIPDGGFVYTPFRSYDNSLERDISYNRTSHLLKRIDVGAEKGYQDFIQNDHALDNSNILHMSSLTERLMYCIDYEAVKQKRNKNFLYLHKYLADMNELSSVIEKSYVNGPMVYPFLRKNNIELRKQLIHNRIYVAMYWPNIPVWIDDKNTVEMYFYNNLIALPIDQRYGLDDMDFIMKIIRFNL